jgi:hypothetical protein
MLVAKLSTPVMILNWIVSTTAVVLAVYLYELEERRHNGFDKGHVFRTKPILVASLLAGSAWAVFTVRLVFRAASACLLEEAKCCCRPEVASGLLLALDSVVSALVFSGAVILVVVWPENSQWGDFVVECKHHSQKYWYGVSTTAGCDELHALVAMMWLLWVTASITVLCTSRMQDGREAKARKAVFDDIESGGGAVAGQSPAAAGKSKSEGSGDASWCCGGSEPGVHTIIMQHRRFTTAQFGVHIGLWVAASLSLSLLASALAGEVGGWVKFKPYDTPEVAFGLSASVVVWLVSTVYVCLSLCKVAVHPVAVVAADTVFLVLTLVSAGVANALGGVNCSGFSLCSQYISGVVFVWLSAALYIVLLVLNVLAVVETTASNTQVKFVRQEGHNINIVVGGEGQAHTQTQPVNQSQAKAPGSGHFSVSNPVQSHAVWESSSAMSPVVSSKTVGSMDF